MNERIDTSAVAAATVRAWPTRYTLIALCFGAVFVCYLDRVVISIAIIAMQDTFGWSETVKGFVLSSFFVGYMLFQIPSGYLANRFGGKIVLGFAVAWWSAATLITPVAAAVSLPVLVLARITMGLGEAATFPAAYNLFGRWVPPAEHSRAVSLLLSGVPIGTLFALGATGWIIARYGWPSAFYVFGAVGIVWVGAWFARAHNDPMGHPRISPRERALLAENRDRKTRVAVPWRRLFSSSAVWALIINHFCSNWSLYMLLAWLPSYFKAQGLGMSSVGLFAAAPWLTMFAVVNVAAWLADRMIQRGRSTTVVRKTMQVAGLSGAAIFLLLAPGAQTAGVALVLMCGALGALGLTWSGFAPNHLEIAPRHADVLMGITNTAGTLPGVIGVAVTGWLVDTTATYASAFALAALINLVGAVVWLAWGSARRVPALND